MLSWGLHGIDLQLSFLAGKPSDHGDGLGAFLFPLWYDGRAMLGQVAFACKGSHGDVGGRALRQNSRARGISNPASLFLPAFVCGFRADWFT